MSELVRNHVGFGHFPWRLELVAQLLEKGKVEVDLLIRRTVERPSG